MNARAAREAPDEPPDWITSALGLLEKGKTVVALVAVLIYGTVRTAYDSFYGHLGVTPEDVGFGETTIIGRAALYFVTFVVALIALGGAWIALTLALTSRGSSDQRVRTTTSVSRLAHLSLTAVLLVLPLAYFFYSREANDFLYDTLPLSGLANFALRWLVFLFTFGVLARGWLYVLREQTYRSRRYSGTTEGGEVPGQSTVLVQTVWALFSLVITLPLVLGFLAPSLAGFIREEDFRGFAGLLMWAFLLMAGFLALRAVRQSGTGTSEPWKQLSPSVRAGIIACLGAAATLVLVLASERGEAFAVDVWRGQPVRPHRYSLLATRAEPVCSRMPGSVLPNRGPFMYLGEANGTTVLYDYKRTDEPQPLRAPSDLTFQHARYLGSMEVSNRGDEEDGRLDIWMCAFPSEGATDVARNATVFVTIDRDAIAASISVSDARGKAVPGSTSQCVMPCRSVAFTHTVPFKGWSTYFVDLSLRTRGSREAMRASWSFTTK